MLRVIHKYIRKASPRSLVKWSQHLDNLKAYQQEHVRRYLASPGSESGAVKLLRHVLNFVDYDVLRKYNDDYSRYSRYITHIREDLNNIFDPANKGLSFNNMFISKTHVYPASEYLFPIDDIDHIKLLPFNQDFSAWKNLKPVVLWHHNSPELCQNLLKDQVQFRYIPPTYSIAFIDVVTLTFMYFKYLEGQPRHMFQWASRQFIHEFVIKNFYEDVLDIWLTQQLSVIAQCETKEDVERVCRYAMSSMENRYGYVGGRYSEASMELFNELNLVKAGNITVSSLLSSRLYPSSSFLDRLNRMDTWLEVPDLRQYRYLRLLRDMPYLDIIVNFYKFIPNIVDVQAFIRELKLECRKIVMDKTFASIRNPAARLHAQESFSKLHETLTSFNV
jgi:hypothetical protein